MSLLKLGNDSTQNRPTHKERRSVATLLLESNFKWNARKDEKKKKEIIK